MSRVSPLNDPNGTFADYEHELDNTAPVTACCGKPFIPDTDIWGGCKEHSSALDCLE